MLLEALLVAPRPRPLTTTPLSLRFRLGRPLTCVEILAISRTLGSIEKIGASRKTGAYPTASRNHQSLRSSR